MCTCELVVVREEVVEVTCVKSIFFVNMSYELCIFFNKVLGCVELVIEELEE